MPKKPLYEETTILFPRADASHGEVARDLLVTTIEAHPELKAAKWSLELKYRSEETQATLLIQAVDPAVTTRPTITIDVGHLIYLVALAIAVGMILEWVWE